MLKCGCLVEWWVYDDGDSGWGGSNYAVFTCFFEFFKLFCPQYCTMCFNITVSSNYWMLHKWDQVCRKERCSLVETDPSEM